jgi:hypothetical protein
MDGNLIRDEGNPARFRRIDAKSNTPVFLHIASAPD